MFATDLCDLADGRHHPVEPPSERRLTSVVAEAVARRIPLPASPLSARARDAVRLDDHVPELAREPVVTTLQHPAAHEPTTDAGAEPDEHQVVDAAAGTQLPLGQTGDGVVVVDQDVQPRPGLQQLAQMQQLDPGEVRRGDEDPVTGHQPWHCHTDRHDRAEVFADVCKGLDQFGWGTRCRKPVFSDDGSIVVERHTEALRPADIDPDRGGIHASARALSSRTVLRMRTSARRFTKPGSGTTNSITRS